MDSPFTRRNSINEDYNSIDDIILNTSNDYMQLLTNIARQYETQNLQYLNLLDRLITYGHQTHLNTLQFRTRHSVRQNQNVRESTESNHSANTTSSNHSANTRGSNHSANTTGSNRSANTRNPEQQNNIHLSELARQLISDSNEQTTIVSSNQNNIEPLNASITPPRLYTPRTTPAPVVIPQTPIRRAVLNSTNRVYNTIGPRRRITEDTPIFPNPLYSLFYTQPYEDVIIRPSQEQINNSSTIIRFSYANWTYNSRMCPIGLTEFEENDEIRILNTCGHFFNKNNIDRWFECNVRCPVCRHDIRENNIDISNNNDVNTLDSDDEINTLDGHNEINTLDGHNEINTLDGDDEINTLDGIDMSNNEINTINHNIENNLLNILTNELTALSVPIIQENSSITVNSLSNILNLDNSNNNI